MKKKKKILALCDHPLSSSGVGIQARYLFNGLLETGEYTIMCLGAAVKHANYDLVKVTDDFLIKPIDGFGNREIIEQLLWEQKPDVLFLFTDPRFFTWVWEMEDEIHQVCPIAYWHVWDNKPWPEYNRVFYESTDLVNCHSYLTYEMVNEHFPEKTNFIPHALPHDVFKPTLKEEKKLLREKLIGKEREDHFVGLWINRNAKRKRPGDLLVSWKMFLDKLEKKHGHKNATLIMHTDPLDDQGANLFHNVDMLGIRKEVFFSTERVSFEDVAKLHGASDFFINIALNEGFGLGTLEAMQCGNPIIAQKTGGLTRQVVDHRDGTENGIALDVEVRSLVGSQAVPYIYEDYVSPETTSDAILKLYEMTADEREALGNKARDYVKSEFDLKKTINDWHTTLSKMVNDWKEDRGRIYTPWECKEL